MFIMNMLLWQWLHSVENKATCYAVDIASMCLCLFLCVLCVFVCVFLCACFCVCVFVCVFVCVCLSQNGTSRMILHLKFTPLLFMMFCTRYFYILSHFSIPYTIYYSFQLLCFQQNKYRVLSINS